MKSNHNLTTRIIGVIFSILILTAMSFAYADTLWLPQELKRIEEEAFYGNTSLDEVVIPNSVTYIGPRAFANSSLKYISLPASITSIADDAFSGMLDSAVLAPVDGNSYASEWCKTHGANTPDDCTLSVSATSWAATASASSSSSNYKSIAVKCDEDYAISIDQPGSSYRPTDEGYVCEWLSYTTTLSGIKLLVAKNYAKEKRAATVTIECKCHHVQKIISVTQSASSESSPTVTMTISPTTVAPGESFTATVKIKYTRFTTVFAGYEGTETQNEQTQSTSSSSTIKTLTYSFTVPKTVRDGVYTVTASACNSDVEHDSWTQSVKATAQLTVATPIHVSSIALSPTSTTITVGETTTLSASISPANATNQNVTWSSSNTNVATVSSAGVVTAKAEGSATITATTEDSGKKATCVVNVAPIPDPFILYPITAGGINVGDTAYLSVAAEHADSYLWQYKTSATGSWTSVSSTWGTGYKTANLSFSMTSTRMKYYFRCKITGNGKTIYTNEVQFVSADLSVSSNLLSGSTIIMNEHAYNGDYCTLSVESTASWTATLSDNSFVKFITADSASATINSATSASGDAGTMNLRIQVVKVPADGSTSTATLSFAIGSTTKTYTVKLTKPVPVTGVTMNSTSELLNIGDYCELSASVNPSTATYQNVIWSTSNSSVATVSSSGKVMANGVGTANITATTEDGGYTATCKVTVFTIEHSNLSGSTLTMGETAYNGDFSTLKIVSDTAWTATLSSSTFVKFVSADSSSATINSATSAAGTAGTKNLRVQVVKAPADGATSTATLTVTIGGKSKTYTIKLTKPVPVSGVSLNTTNITLDIGDTYTLKATVSPSTATHQEVNWQTSNSSVATISSTGKVTAKATGAAIITVTTDDGGYEATCYVNVNMVLPTPTIKTATALSESSVKLTWTSSNGADGYEIYRSLSKYGDYVKIADVDGYSTVTYQDKQLSPDTTYWYYVRAYYAEDGELALYSDSAVKSVTTDEGEVIDYSFDINHAIEGNILEKGSMAMHNRLNDDGTGPSANWTITASNSWTLSISGDTHWFTTSTKSGSAGSTKLTITIRDWTTALNSATLTFKSYDDAGNLHTHAVVIYQRADSYDPDASLELSTYSWEPGYTSTSKSITVSASGTYSVSVDMGDVSTNADTAWLSYSKSGSTLKLYTRKNYGNAPRSAVVTVSCGNLIKTINVTQDYGASAPTINLRVGDICYNGKTYGPLVAGDTLYLNADYTNSGRLFIRIFNSSTNKALDGSTTTAVVNEDNASYDGTRYVPVPIPSNVQAGTYIVEATVTNSDVQNDPWAQKITVSFNLTIKSKTDTGIIGTRSVSFSESDSIATKFSKIQAALPHGEYFNQVQYNSNGEAISERTNVTITSGKNVFTTWTTNHRCPATDQGTYYKHKSGTSTCNHVDGSGNTLTTAGSTASQCAGFAKLVGTIVWGANCWDADYCIIDPEDNELDKLEAGDIIQYRVTSSNSVGHTVIVTGVSKDETGKLISITVGECNWNDACKIEWGRKITREGLTGVKRIRKINKAK